MRDLRLPWGQLNWRFDAEIGWHLQKEACLNHLQTRTHLPVTYRVKVPPNEGGVRCLHLPWGHRNHGFETEVRRVLQGRRYQYGVKDAWRLGV